MSRADLRAGVLRVVAEGDDHDEVRQKMADDPNQGATIRAGNDGTHGPAVI